MKSTLTLDAFRKLSWSCLCSIDVSLLTRWAEAADEREAWPQQRQGQPQRIKVPHGVVWPVLSQVLACFPCPARVNHQHVCLSRVVPGEGHGYHRDAQQRNWITRVHLPLITNSGCWFAFEEEGGTKVHFEVGQAYSFNTLQPHSFGNDGETARVHLLFDVLEDCK